MRHIVSPRFRAAAAAGAMAAVLPLGCAPDGQTVQGVRLVGRGVLTICTHLPYAPFQFQRGGAVVGFDVDLLDLVARRLGVRQKVIDVRFTAITSGRVFTAGACDLAAAGITITPRRAEVLGFSRPYSDSGQALMTRREVQVLPAVPSLGASGRVASDPGTAGREASDAGASGPGAFDAGAFGPGGLRVGVVAGTTGQEYARTRAWRPKAYDNPMTELDALRTGQIDVLVQDDPVVRYWLTDRANADFVLVPGLRTREQYGFAAGKGHGRALLGLVDEVVAQARRSGVYRRIYERWMGPMPQGAWG